MKKTYVFLAFLLVLLPISGQQLPTKQEIITKMRLVNDYWIAQNPSPGNNQWARAVYFTGNVEFYKTYPKDAYNDYNNLWANNNSWALNGGSSTRNADNQTCGQVYIDLYNMDAVKQPNKIAVIKTSIDNMVSGTKTDDWWWIDAIYMSMPVFARLGVLTGDSAYFSRMYDLYYNTKVTRALYNTNSHLWYRDETYDPPYYTPNGKDSYWARGNGWVIAAHVRILQLLPANNSHRAEYISTFTEMAAALKERQREDGFWNCSLDDPNQYGGPETSGTAFFTYGLAWGINNHLLDSATYYPVVQKAWDALANTAVQTTGFLGYVQGVGAGPAATNISSTADFGVGAFLLAGTEVVKMAKGTLPVLNNFGLKKIVVNKNTEVILTFTKKVDFSTISNLANYYIDNGVQIKAATQTWHDSIVVLFVSPLDKGKYTLQISNIASATGEIIEEGTTATFTYTGIASITASGYETGTSNTPDKTMDFDLGTRWSANGKGQWILYDLGETQLIKSLDIAFYSGTVRKTFFSINLSENNTDYTEVYNGESGGTSNDPENFDFNDQRARYVKIIGGGNSVSTWNSITELRINSETITGITQPQNSHLHLFPNPATQNELIRLSGNIAQASVFDLSGHLILRTGEQTEKLQIRLPSGCYLVKIIDTDQQTSVEKLIIR